MVKYTEDELIAGVKAGTPQIILFIMKKYSENIRKMIADFKISRFVQPEDVIQDGMVELILNLRQDKFNGKSSIITYYYSICRYICLKLYKKHKEFYTDSDLFDIADDHAVNAEEDDRLDCILKLLVTMKKECTEIISLRFGLSFNHGGYEQLKEKRGFEEVAEILNIEPANARQRFGRCIQTLLVDYQKGIRLN